MNEIITKNYSLYNGDCLDIMDELKSIIKINKSINANYHPTQKPVQLMEHLIKTYTKENETVLDFCMGSGTTGVACLNTNRKFIGIELDEKYFITATKRIKDTEEK